MAVLTFPTRFNCPSCNAPVVNIRGRYYLNYGELERYLAELEQEQKDRILSLIKTNKELEEILNPLKETYEQHKAQLSYMELYEKWMKLQENETTQS